MKAHPNLSKRGGAPILQAAATRPKAGTQQHPTDGRNHARMLHFISIT